MPSPGPCHPSAGEPHTRKRLQALTCTRPSDASSALCPTAVCTWNSHLSSDSHGTHDLTSFPLQTHNLSPSKLPFTELPKYQPDPSDRQVKPNRATFTASACSAHTALQPLPYTGRLVAQCLGPEPLLLLPLCLQLPLGPRSPASESPPMAAAASLSLSPP